MAKNHQPCPNEDCGSSDALRINDDGSTYCFSCRTYTSLHKRKKRETQAESVTGSYTLPVEGRKSGIPERGLTVNTLERYTVRQTGDSIHFPLFDGTNPCGAKIRSTTGKQFSCTGDVKRAGLFGQQAFSPGSAKSITITEGELDCLSVYQMQGSKYPAVSIKNGASGAVRDCKDQFSYLNSFEEIVVNFDNDEPGQEAARQVCALFPGKARNLILSKYKDANEYLMKGERDAYTTEWWKAPLYKPDCIINGKDLYDDVMSEMTLPFTNYPWDGLNAKTYGIRRGEIVLLTAGSGQGKSTVIKTILAHTLKRNADVKLGVMSLEETAGMAAKAIMSIFSNKQYNLLSRSQVISHVLNDENNLHMVKFLAEEINQEEMQKDFNATLGTGRFEFLKAEGNTNISDILGHMNYMARVAECDIIVLDHISILVGMQQAQTYGNEREAIDECMHKLRNLVENTGCTILLVSHLSRGSKDRKAHEEGGRVSTDQIRGSQSIAQLSNIAIAIERDAQAEDEVERNTSTVRVLKNRYNGQTGECCRIRWIEETGQLKELPPGYIAKQADEEAI